ncbi:MAG: ABC transporter ATP-binding protein [Saprospiraceae bacterium]
MKELASLNHYFWKYRWRLSLGILFIVGSNIFAVWQPKVIRQALDIVVNYLKEAQGKHFQVESPEVQALSSQLAWFGLAALGLAFCMGIFMYFMRQTVIVMSRLVEYDMRKEIFEHYEKLDQSFFRRSSTGDLMARITEDVSKVRQYMGPALLYGINMVFLFSFVIYSMFSVNAKLAFFSILPLPFLSISIYFISNIINKKSTSIQQQLAVLNSTAQEVYSGIKVIKSYAQEDRQINFFKEQAAVYMDKNMSMTRINAYFSPLMILIIGISTIITIYVGGLQVIQGELTPGNIAEFVIYVNMLTWPVTSIGWIASLVQQASASQKRINEFLKLQPEILSPLDESRKFDGHIEFKSVALRYSDTGITALEKLNFSVLPGQKVALIGRTGSGKTSIADLILRMYDPTVGAIYLDGVDLRKLDLHNLRQRIGYVPQDLFLFSDTVSNNIAFGQVDTDIETIEAFARHASVHDDIQRLPAGFETVVGERGVTLSGGQKQRISIARALIKSPDLIILDDCLSAVDSNTEMQITGYLNDALEDKTAIIITHRIYTSLQFDQILVLGQGTIVESGKHEELLAAKGYYAGLFEQQQLEDLAINEN